MSTAVEQILPLTEPVASLAYYRDNGGGTGLAEALRIGPDEVIAEVGAAGLRGRGGAGLPTAAKWAATRGSGPVSVVCNAAEGELGTFKDRFILRRNAYQVLEGLAIAAVAVGARHAYIGIRRTCHVEIAALVRALDELAAARMLGPASIRLVLGPDEYLFGEETAMLAATEAPTEVVVNNVETLAHVSAVLRLGANGFRANGSTDSPGTTVFTLSGDVRMPGLYELPLGVSLRMLVELFGAGTPSGRLVKAVFPGAGAAPLTGSRLDVPLDYESVCAAGSALGSAGLVVYDDSTCMVAAALAFCRFLATEPAGQCPRCQRRDQRIAVSLARIERGDGAHGDLAALHLGGGQRCCPPTGAAKLIRGVLAEFAEEFTEHLSRPCPRPRDLPVPRLVDFDEPTGRFTYPAVP
ncbi:MAG TPA: NADH-ubiquinone oxidoreductase-F iron-sulfur binding region domain-containing protein, partial [Pseudonocardiaceae bacterium]